MKTKSILFAFLTLNGMALISSVDASAALTLSQMVDRAEQTSPDLRAAMSRAESARASISIAKAAFLPTLGLEAISSYGFPGSSRDLGISGLMGSSFRSGPAAGLVSDLTLVDFGRQADIEATKQTLKAAEAQVQVARFQVDQSALQTYIDASRARGQRDAAHQVVDDTKGVEKEVVRFVRTGQRSVVERLLVHDQTTEAEMNEAAFGAQYQAALERVSLWTGLPGA